MIDKPPSSNLDGEALRRYGSGLVIERQALDSILVLWGEDNVQVELRGQIGSIL